MIMSNIQMLRSIIISNYKQSKLTMNEICYITGLSINKVSYILGNNGFYYGTQQKPHDLFYDLNSFQFLNKYNFSQKDFDIYYEIRNIYGKRIFSYYSFCDLKKTYRNK